MRNILTVDVEDYFHVEAFAGTVSRDQWPTFPSRVERNTRRILELFDAFQAKATFFIRGCVAEQFPRLVRDIAAAGHEIGSHGYGHRRLQGMSPKQFREDIKRSVSILSSEVQRPI